MTTSAQTFDANISGWKENMNTPWGRLRYRIAFANLRRYLELEGRPLRVLDAGGGSGAEALHFAAQGHSVALLDYSKAMLDEARRAAQESGVAQQITFHQGDLASIPGRFSPAEFDVVLCHNVLQYVENLEAALEAMCHVLRPEGLLSIISINRFSEAYRRALQQLDLSGAYEALDTHTIQGVLFDVPMRVYAAEEMVPPLEAAGCSVLGNYGIRCICDYIHDNEIKSDPDFYEKLERLELAVSDKHPYNLLARFFQLIACKE